MSGWTFFGRRLRILRDMQNLSSGRLQHSFFFRVWFENTGDHAGQWRGSVEHINSGQRMYFRLPAEALDFVTLCFQENPISNPFSPDKAKGPTE
jgi:hypothetical protein